MIRTPKAVAAIRAIPSESRNDRHAVSGNVAADLAVYPTNCTSTTGTIPASAARASSVRTASRPRGP